MYNVFMNVAVVYNSKTGFTKSYASYIAKETGGTLLSLKEAKRDKTKCDILVFGTYTIASKLSKISTYEKIKGRYNHSFLFVTGARPYEDGKSREYYYLPGGINYEKMSSMKRGMMKLFLKSLDKDSDIYKMLSSSYSFYNEKYAKEIIKDINNTTIE